jgi:ATP-dependent DNA helicase RecG
MSPKKNPSVANEGASLHSSSSKVTRKSKKISLLPPYHSETPLSLLGWITRPQVTALGKLGLQTLHDLLEYYPRRHEDRRCFDRFPKDESDCSFCLCGTVGKTLLRYFGRIRSFEAELEESPEFSLGTRLTLRWFHLFHVQKSVLTGTRIIVYGRPRLRGKRLFLEQPEFEIIDSVISENEEAYQSIHLDRIAPIYPAGAGISARVIRRLMHRALLETDWSHWSDPLPERDISWSAALQKIHFPSEPKELEEARRELALRELLGIQTLVIKRRNEMRRPRGTPKKSRGILFQQLCTTLPFTLTKAQSRAIAVVRSDMAELHRMHRLLQGDVGSGKTLVAAAAILFALESGHGALLMAPTQILAEQHFRNFSSWFTPLDIPVALLTGTRKIELPLPKKETPPSLIIGTHALLHNEQVLADAGLVVIDEQHKFGVLQRAKIASGVSAPDLLVMTATPIPRTLAQTLYGDLDLSLLDEQPSGRGILRTAVRSSGKLPEIITYLRKQLAQGRQAYIVYPLIEESEKLTAKAAEVEISSWNSHLPPYSCSLLHGQMNAEEKKAIMEKFVQGMIHVLVTTSLIEVGIDVPNATFLLVENAERFGLAQLHQLRGRIGRGPHLSTCVLIEGSGNPTAMERLQILEKSSDGFFIAEEDLRLRGGGDILGTAQSGLPPLKIADLTRDADLLRVALREATRILQEDTTLATSQYASLRKLCLDDAAQFPEMGD